MIQPNSQFNAAEHYALGREHHYGDPPIVSDLADHLCESLGLWKSSPSYGLLLELTCFDPMNNVIEIGSINKDNDLNMVKTSLLYFPAKMEELPEEKAEPVDTGVK